MNRPTAVGLSGKSACILGLIALSASTARADIWGYSEVWGDPGVVAHGRSVTYSPLGEQVAAEAWMRFNGGSGQYVSDQGWGMASADAFLTLPPTGGGNVEVTGYHARYYCCDGSGWIYEDQSYAYWGYNDPNGGGGGGGGGSGSECIPIINGIVPNAGPSSGYLEVYGSGLSTVTSAYLASASSVNIIPVSDEQLNISFDGVSPGQQSLTVENSCGGSNAAVYTVQPDPTPTINSVEPSLWQAGQNYDVVISGSGFGTSPSVTITNIQGVDYWVQSSNDIQINLRVEVSSSAPSQNRDLTVTSNGYWGNGFQGQGNPPAGQPKPVSVVSGNQTLSLVVRANNIAINEGSTVLISNTPAMPSITARWETATGQPAQTGSASYRLVIEYNGASNSFPYGPPALIPAGQYWSPPNLGFYGGTATLEWTLNGSTRRTFQFQIRGQNPSAQQVTSLLNASYWFAMPIAEQESGLKQFKPDGTPLTGPGGEGWGIMQLDPPDNEEQKWNWSVNVQAGLARLQQQYVAGGYQFWRNQATQWHDWNEEHAGNAQLQRPAPEDRVESSCTFTLSPSNQIPWTQPTNGGGIYWFGDAIAIKRYNGASYPPGPNILPLGQYLTWNNSLPGYAGNPGWHFQQLNAGKPSANIPPFNYVNQVCSQ